MKHIRTALPFVLLVLLAACTPRTSTPTAAAPEIVYAAPAPEIYAVIVRAISTSPGLPESNGWIIAESDRAGGFIRTQTVTERTNLRNIYEPFEDVHTVSVVVSPNESGKETAVVTQFSRQGSQLVLRIHGALEAAFGVPLKTGTLTPTN